MFPAPSAGSSHLQVQKPMCSRFVCAEFHYCSLLLSGTCTNIPWTTSLEPTTSIRLGTEASRNSSDIITRRSGQRYTTLERTMPWLKLHCTRMPKASQRENK
ncbi:hypothetical protein DPMN_173545 [Dreissena polymorpha]|uniref:Uncharacterized protein n=1 Tax=Dreissena polymorpha TaxID=45954 RepID=A0A9D4IH14_DREPO|nr:hypothetical protein DPMN_173545 [Dreissena polymorpha]